MTNKKLTNIEKIYTPTSMQKSLLNASLINPNDGFYIEQLVVTIEGVLNINIFKSAWEKIVTRHEILRSVFAWQQLEDIKQIVLKNIKLEINEIDLSDYIPNEYEKFVKDYIDKDSINGFQLNKPPLFRIVIFKIEHEKYKIFYSFHHAIIDGSSIGILFSELSYLYDYIQNNKSINLPKAADYETFVNWSNKQNNNDKIKNFWKKKLKEIDKNTCLPRSLQPLTFNENKHKSISKTVDSIIFKKITQFCRKNHITLNSFISGTWALLLHLYCTQEKITYGCVYTIRPQELKNIDSIVGPLINTIPITLLVKNDISLIDYFKYVQISLSRYHENSSLSLDAILDIYLSEKKIAGSSANSNNLFDCIIAFEKFSSNQFDESSNNVQENFNITDISILEKITFPLALICYPAQDNIKLKLIFHTNKIDEHYANNMINEILEIIKLIVLKHDETDTIKDIKLDLENNFSTTSGKVIENQQNLNDFIHKNALLHPDQTAFIDKKNKLTYRELSLLVKKLSVNLPIRYSDVVGVYLPRGIPAFVSIYAIFEKGACYLPLDPSIPKERLEFIIKDSKVKYIIGDGKSSFNNINDIKYISYNDFIKNEYNNINTTNHTEDRINFNKPSYIIYTSGSTGNPKGVINSYEGLSNLCTFCLNLVHQQNESFLQFSSLNFDASILEMCLAAVTCSSLTLIPDQIRTNTNEIENFINTHNITMAFMPTTLANYFNKSNLPKLKTLIIGGEACPAKLAETWSKDRIFYNVYGPSEAAAIVAFNPVNITKHPYAIGYPAPNMVFKILSPDYMTTPEGVPGELFIQGKSVGIGYINLPEISEKSFINNGYMTGDLCYQDKNKLIVFIQRKDKQIKINGQRIELGEIEKNICKIPNTKDAVVIPFSNGTNNISLHAFVRHNIITNDLNKYLIKKLRQYLPSYMIPRNFYSIKEWQLTKNKKIDKTILKEIIFANLSNEQNAPCSTNTEKVIAQYFENLFDYPERIYQKNDDFFFLGGDSILATTLILKLSKYFKINIPLQSIYDYPQINNLASYIDNLLNPSESIKINNFINLDEEAKLDEGFDFIDSLKKPEPIQTNNPKTILLTGSTGFVGVFLLKQLLNNTNAEIICLIRAENNIEAKNRIINSLTKSFLFNKKDSERIIAYSADLFSPYFGLNKEIYQTIVKNVDIIYHCGANVNLAESYLSMANDNIIATKNIIKFASTGKIKPINYTSTISVISSLSTQKNIIMENDDIPYQNLENNGYVMTKWVAEKMFLNARKKGIPVNIYRLPRIWGSTTSGYSNQNDALLILIWSSLIVNSIPKEWSLNKGNIDLMPVDYLVKIIINVSLTMKDLGNTYQMQYPYKISMYDLINYLRQLGYVIEEESSNDWLNKIQSIVSNPEGNIVIKSAFGILSSFNNESSSQIENYVIDCSNTNELLQSQNFQFEIIPFIPNLMNKYINYLSDKYNFPKLN